MPKQGKSYALGPGAVTKRSTVEAEERGWAPAEDCLTLSDRRVIYEVDQDAGTRRTVGVVAKRFAGDVAVVGPFAKALEERRGDVAVNRLVRVADICTTDEIASRVRLKVNTIQKWTFRYPEFPDPIIEYTWLNLYDWHEVMGWIARKFPAYAARVAEKHRLVDA
jgi:hypothetical protein